MPRLPKDCLIAQQGRRAPNPLPAFAILPAVIGGAAGAFGMEGGRAAYRAATRAAPSRRRRNSDEELRFDALKASIARSAKVRGFRAGAGQPGTWFKTAEGPDKRWGGTFSIFVSVGVVTDGMRTGIKVAWGSQWGKGTGMGNSTGDNKVFWEQDANVDKALDLAESNLTFIMSKKANPATRRRASVKDVEVDGREVLLNPRRSNPTLADAAEAWASRRRNSDEELRALERAASLGDANAIARLDAMKTRSGIPTDELDEKIVLFATMGFKPSYEDLGTATRFVYAHRATAITPARWEAAKARLIAKKILNKAGAVTPAGRAGSGHRPGERELDQIGRGLGVDSMRREFFKGDAKKLFDTHYQGRKPNPHTLADAAESWAQRRGMRLPARGSAAWQGMFAAWQRGGMARNPQGALAEGDRIFRVSRPGRLGVVTGIVRWGHYESRPQGEPRYVHVLYDDGVRDTLPAESVRRVVRGNPRRSNSDEIKPSWAAPWIAVGVPDPDYGSGSLRPATKNFLYHGETREDATRAAWGRTSVPDSHWGKVNGAYYWFLYRMQPDGSYVDAVPGQRARFSNPRRRNTSPWDPGMPKQAPRPCGRCRKPTTKPMTRVKGHEQHGYVCGPCYVALRSEKTNPYGRPLDNHDIQRLSHALAQEDDERHVMDLTPLELMAGGPGASTLRMPTVREAAETIAHATRRGPIEAWETWVREVIGWRGNTGVRRPNNPGAFIFAIGNSPRRGPVRQVARQATRRPNDAGYQIKLPADRVLGTMPLAEARRRWPNIGIDTQVAAFKDFNRGAQPHAEVILYDDGRKEVQADYIAAKAPEVVYGGISGSPPGSFKNAGGVVGGDPSEQTTWVHDSPNQYLTGHAVIDRDGRPITRDFGLIGDMRAKQGWLRR